MTRQATAALLVLCLLPCGLAAGAWHVDRTNTSGVEDGTTWGAAFTTLQQGIEAAAASSSDNEVWVAAGAYDEARVHSSGALVLRPGVRVYGGFSGSETQRDERDWTAHVTTIDGSSARSGSPACHVVIGADGATLDGFTITGGQADGSYAYSRGGGMYNCFASPAVAHCTFTGNSATELGGAIFNYHFAPIIIDCTFANNTAGDGGAIANFQSSATIGRCAFSGNSATAGGGAIANKGDCEPVIADCTFTGNGAATGGAVDCTDHNGAILRGCTFDNNWSTLSGGAASIRTGSNTTFKRCTLSNNSAAGGNGGALSVEAALPIIMDCTFNSNSAGAGNGGALNGEAALITLERSAFNGNSAGAGGAIYVIDTLIVITNAVFWSNDALDGNGGAIAGYGQYGTTATNCTFYGNSASSQGGALYSDSTVFMNIRNSILWGDTPSEADGGSPSIIYSDVQGGFTGTGNINTAPGFIDAAAGDLMLTSGAACVGRGSNSGAPATDIRGVTRPLPAGGRVDMGAYEVGSSGPTAAFEASPLAGDASLPVSFSDESLPGSSSITTWLWNFGDGNTSSEANPEHVYQTAGTYTVSLTVTTADGSGTITKTDLIAVSGGPNADFEADPASGDAPLSVDFADLSEPGVMPITSWSWDFGDGESSAAQNPAHTYTETGIYTVALTVTTSAGQDSASAQVNVGGPVPGFTADPQIGYESLTVTFTGQSTPGTSAITAWYWDFGDTQTSTDQNPVHTYTAPGAYTVSLSVTNAIGTVTEVKEDFICVYRRFYVDQANASGTEDGLSWATAFTTIQAGINAAYSAGGMAEVWVAEGTYDEARTSSTGAVVMRHTVHLYGGFDKTETARADRDWTANPAIIDGTAARGGLRAYHVVIGAEDATLDGFTIQGGNANDGDDSALMPEDCGGGMFNSDISTTIANCTFTGNAAYEGGGMLNDHASVTVLNCTFDNNSAVLDGAGMNNFYAAPIIQGCTFSNNTVDLYAGAIYNESACPQVIDCTFAGNSAAYGGAVLNYYCAPQYFACSFSSNTADYGGAMYNEDSAPILTECSFSNNAVPDATGWGGGMFSFDCSSPHLNRCTFSSNSAAIGGALYNYDQSCPVVVNCVFDANTATHNGGGMFNGMSRPTVINSTFYGNTAASTAGLYNYNCAMAPRLTNCILWNDGAAEISDVGGTKTIITYSAVQGSPLYTGTGNTNQDPGFADRANGDYHLNPASPCKDAGTATEAPAPGAPEVDIENVPRPQDLGIDIGAYEYAVAPQAAFEATPASGPNPLTVAFTDTSSAGTSPITAWLWDFGDGATSTSQHPSHEYTSWGKFTVSLTITTTMGSDILTRTDFINVTEGPTAWFSASPTSGAGPLTVTFTDESVPGSASIVAWSWDFDGDGVEDSDEQHPTHVFDPGTYTIALTVTSSDDLTDTRTITDYIIVQTLPTASFSAVPTTGFAPLTVDFTDTSSPGSAPITAWAWDFGDGETSAGQNPQHTYAAPGTYTVALTVTTLVGAHSRTETDFITVNPSVGPTAAFAAAPMTGMNPLTVVFSDESIAGTWPITEWLWDFGDGQTSTDQNPQHTYAAAGTYTVSLSVTTDAGVHTHTEPGLIVVNQSVGPTAAFSATPASGEYPLAVAFTDESAPGTWPITAWFWDFGDGGTSTLANPAHTYTAAGAYTVSLTVTTQTGSDTDTRTSYIDVQAPAPPEAAFSASPTSGVSPLAVDFTDLSTPGSGPITSWLWAFGDGATSTQASPTHTYTETGAYTVALTVTGAGGADTETKTGYIQVHAPTLPTAAFSATPTFGLQPLTVQFTDSSTAGTGPITSWAWDFGDGQTSTEQNPQHVYQDDGVFTVSLTVTTAYGSDTEERSSLIEVDPNTPPTAGFTATPTSGKRPLTVQFSDTSQPGTNPITAWLWDFGDGQTSTAQSPEHIYQTAGVFTVSLTVTTATGSDTETRTDLIAVEPEVGPLAAFDAEPISGVAPLEVVFTDHSVAGTAPIATWLWVFGDGQTSTQQNPTHTYQKAGTYTVSLSVFTADGSDIETKTGLITVLPEAGPTADFAADPRSGPWPLGVSFTDVSEAGTSAIASWLWDFGDGQTSAQQNPSHTYGAAGDYTVSLTVTTAVGSDTETKAAYISIQAATPPSAIFTGAPTSGMRPLTVAFSDQSTPGTSPITDWLWSFGDGETSAQQNPVHIYQNAGAYTVTLTVTSAAGTDGMTRSNYIEVQPGIGPTAAFSGQPTAGHQPLTVSFTDESAAGTSSITDWLWDFGDGQTSTEPGPVHTYQSPGAYTVALTVTTLDGTDTSTVSDYIQVSPIVYVDIDNTSGVEDGTSWATAFTELQDGIDTAASAGGVHVWVAEGTYNEHRADADGALVMASGVHIFGGFTGTETSPDQRDWEACPAIIDGSSARNGSRAYHVVLGADNATLDGFTITGGRANNSNSNRERGGGMYNDSVSPLIANCIFSDNGADYYGGAVYNGGGAAPAFQGCTFTGNEAAGTLFSQGYGGAMFNRDADPAIINCVFQENAANPAMFSVGSGGAIYSRDSAPVIINSTFYANEAVGTLFSSGDGGALYNRDSSPQVINSILWGNEPNQSENQGSSSLTITYSDIEGGHSGDGNLNSDPLFIGTGGHPCALTASSPCRNQGSLADAPADDLLGIPRPQGTAPDMGAYEYWTGPEAAFEVDTTSGFNPLDVHFTDTSVSGTSPLTGWLWDFGDGYTSTAQHPAHTYLVPGAFTVALTVTSAVGADTETKTGFITVDAATGPSADFFSDITTGTQPLTVQFFDESLPGTWDIVEWYWDFGDGKTLSGDQSPVHTYDTPGTYTVSLTVTTMSGTDTLILTGLITVDAGLPASHTGGLALLTGLLALTGIAMMTCLRAPGRRP